MPPLPWEYKEMGCAYAYLMAKCENIAREISDDLRELMNNTGCQFFWQIQPEDQRVPFGCEMEVISNLDIFPQHFNIYTAVGPGFLYRVLHADRLRWRNMIMVNTKGGELDTFIGPGLWDS